MWRATWAEIAAADPDWIVAMPCGFDEAGAAAEIRKIAERPEWTRLRAVRESHVLPVDANGQWSRPGPRLVDGVERLARALHPAAFGLPSRDRVAPRNPGAESE